MKIEAWCANCGLPMINITNVSNDTWVEDLDALLEQEHTDLVNNGYVCKDGSDIHIRFLGDE
jgi:hypothetical protein